MQQETKASLILLVIPILWGITFPLIEKVVVNHNPSVFVFWRFITAALILMPAAINSIKVGKFCWADLRYGLLLGILNSGTFILQAVALKSVDSSRTAFLTGINVVMVPFILPFFIMKKPKFIEITAAIVCLTGIYIISNANLTGLSDGDLIVVSSAFCIALGIVVTEKVSIVSRDFKILIFYQLLFTCIAPTIILRSDLLIIPCDGFFWSVVFYCAILGTIMPLFLQLKYQKFVGSNKVAIIFSLESVVATFCAWLFGGEIDFKILIGGAVILFSAIINDLYRVIPPKNNVILK